MPGPSPCRHGSVDKMSCSRRPPFILQARVPRECAASNPPQQYWEQMLLSQRGPVFISTGNTVRITASAIPLLLPPVQCLDCRDGRIDTFDANAVLGFFY